MALLHLAILCLLQSGVTKIGRLYSWNIYFAIGMALLGIGLMIRIHSILTLKQSFTYSVAKVENQEIIETGLYRFLRHPGYLGQLIPSSWDFNFIIQLAFNPDNDDTSWVWIHLSDRDRRKVYARAVWK